MANLKACYKWFQDPFLHAIDFLWGSEKKGCPVQVPKLLQEIFGLFVEPKDVSRHRLQGLEFDLPSSAPSSLNLPLQVAPAKTPDRDWIHLVSPNLHQSSSIRRNATLMHLKPAVPSSSITCAQHGCQPPFSGDWRSSTIAWTPLIPEDRLKRRPTGGFLRRRVFHLKKVMKPKMRRCEESKTSPWTLETTGW